MFKISISIISVLILLLAIYSSTIVSIDYFGDNNSKLPEPRHEMRMFHEPSPEIRKNEIELEKEYRKNEVSREISQIDSMLKNIENAPSKFILNRNIQIISFINVNAADAKS